MDTPVDPVGWCGRKRIPESAAGGRLHPEDALQAAAAEAWAADRFVTRDGGGFAGSPVPILSPDEFLQRFPPPRTPVENAEGEKA